MQWLALLLSGPLVLGVQTPTDDTGEPDPMDARLVTTAAYSRVVSERASHLSLGYSLGRMGEGFATGLRLDLPLGETFVLRLMSNVNHGPLHGTYDPLWSNGAHVLVRGPVLFGLVRLYSGGGCWLGWRPNPNDEGATTGLTGGGYSGIEFFARPSRAFYLEIGGQGGVHEGGVWRDGGAQVKAGSMFYF